MKDKRILSIVPDLPPAVNGLGDYSWLLAKEMKEGFGWNTVFASMGPITGQKDFPIEYLRQKYEASLLQAFQKHLPEKILLHYVGYAYSEKALPFWLIKALKKYRRERNSCQLITIFHELYSSGMPWKKAFWTKSLQKKIAFDLLNLSDNVIANTPITYAILKERSKENNIDYLPVFSNLGEPQKLPRFSDRKNHLVLFGSSALREKSLKNNTVLTSWMKEHSIEKIIEIGPYRKENSADKIVDIQQLGVLPAIDISEILLRSKFGLLEYPIHLLSKSGVFAAYVSHGVVPVISSSSLLVRITEKGEADLVKDSDISKIAEIIESNLRWYNQHSLKKTADCINKLLEAR